MTRSAPFLPKRRRYTTPAPAKAPTTEAETESASTTSNYREPSSVMPRPVDHTTTNPGLVAPTQKSARFDDENVSPEYPDVDEEGRIDDPSTPTQSTLPQMSPELRLALVQELLKQMKATSQPKPEAQIEPETEDTAPAYLTQLTAQTDEMQAPEEPPEEQDADEPAVETPSNSEEVLERNPPPTAEENEEPHDDAEPPTQVEASKPKSGSSEHKPEVDNAIIALKTDAKINTEIKIEAQRIAALLNTDESESKSSTFVTQEPETSDKNKQPVTPSAFLLELRERAKNRPSIRSSRRRSRPKPRPRAKKRKSLPRGPRPERESGLEEPDASEEDDDSEETSAKDHKHPWETRAKLHQLVDEELSGQSDASDAEDLDTQP